MGQVAEGEAGDQVAEVAVRLGIVESDKFCLSWVNTKSTACHPVDDSVKMGGNDVHRLLVVPCHSD
jgi:hypothetical protein